MFSTVTHLLHDPDFRAHPVRGVARRVQWRLHWRLRSNRPVVISNWHSNMSIELPHSSAGAQVFYRRYSSLAGLRATLAAVHSGMTVLDIGAHVGEYTMITANLTGASGHVHAIEPQPALCKAIARNASRNGLAHVTVHSLALGESEGLLRFHVDSRSMGGWISDGPDSQSVPCARLDDFIETQRIRQVGFVKLDGAGNEAAVIRGGKRFLSMQRPIVLSKLYSPEVVRDRFACKGDALLDALESCGYEVRLLEHSEKLFGDRIRSFDQLLSHFANGAYCLHVLAVTREGALDQRPAL